MTLPAASAAIRAKAEHLLVTGRVRVTEANDDTGLFVASVEGSTGSYVVFRASASSPWHCGCDAAQWGKPCCHVAAVATVAP